MSSWFQQYFIEPIRNHPQITFGIIVFLVLMVIIIPILASSSERFANGNVLVTSPAGALDRVLGSCLSEPGRDHCGAAEAFGSKKYISRDQYLKGQSHFAAHPAALLKHLRGNKQRFLNERNGGPDFTATAPLDADYWYQELTGMNGNSDSGDSGADAVSASMAAAQAAAQAVQAVQTGAIPAAAAPVMASKFAAQKARRQGFVADDALLASQLAATH